MIRRFLASPVALAVALAVSHASLAAQRPPPSGEPLHVDPEAKAAIDRIRSPYCPGMMLEVCTSAGGAMLRDSIQRMAESGLKADSIVELVIAEYGEEWRAEPLHSGAGLWAWVLPPAVLVLGLGAVGVVLARRRRSQGPDEAEPPPEVSPDDEQRLKDALKVLDEEEEPVF